MNGDIKLKLQGYALTDQEESGWCKDCHTAQTLVRRALTTEDMQRRNMHRDGDKSIFFLPLTITGPLSQQRRSRGGWFRTSSSSGESIAEQSRSHCTIFSRQ